MSVHYGAEIASIDFGATLLATKRPNAIGLAISKEPDLHSSSMYREEVWAVLTISLLEHHPKIDCVASKLGRSRRSLQRSLEAKGCSFSLVLEAILKDRAVDWLRWTEHSVTEIALKLGYSDNAHFSWAFRNWTGTSPTRFRKMHSK